MARKSSLPDPESRQAAIETARTMARQNPSMSGSAIIKELKDNGIGARRKDLLAAIREGKGVEKKPNPEKYKPKNPRQPKPKEPKPEKPPKTTAGKKGSGTGQKRPKAGGPKKQPTTPKQPPSKRPKSGGPKPGGSGGVAASGRKTPGGGQTLRGIAPEFPELGVQEFIPVDIL